MTFYNSLRIFWSNENGGTDCWLLMFNVYHSVLTRLSGVCNSALKQQKLKGRKPWSMKGWRPFYWLLIF